MPWFPFWLAVATLLLVVVTTIEFAIGNRSLARLTDQPTYSEGGNGRDAARLHQRCSADESATRSYRGDRPPKVSVVIAARNEARRIGQGLQSVLAQDYPNLEFIVVDDRSTDETGRILDHAANRDSRLRVVHVADVPTGWLGKTHALHLGAARATGDLLLFTDADVIMEPSVIGRAVSFIMREQIDHLAVTPQLRMPGTLLSMFGGVFALFFAVYAKPWQARNPRSPRHIGIGAFNLLRADVYRAIGGHRAIAMRPDDDMKLGKLIKKHGYRQDVALGGKLMTVEWYSSLGELVRGLEKNTYAGVDYSFPVVLLSSMAQIIICFWPMAALLVTRGATWWLNLAIVALLALLYIDTAQSHRAKRWHCVGIPVTALLFQYIIWRATLKTLWNDGIDWRGTHYSLKELRANKV
jgi:cellulose synthase/poly-beta-1,6-N-acetylglucosamine synthase-like glycosyltransferase